MDWTENTRLLQAVVLNEDEVNTTHPLANIIPGRVYLVLGEVACENEEGQLQGIRHYVLQDLGSGKIEPGMYHDDRFRAATDEDL